MSTGRHHIRRITPPPADPYTAPPPADPYNDEAWPHSQRAESLSPYLPPPAPVVADLAETIRTLRVRVVVVACLAGAAAAGNIGQLAALWWVTR